MSFIEKIMSWFGGKVVPSADIGRQLPPSREAEELLPKEARKETKAEEKVKPKKKASAKKAGYTKASLDKMTKAQLVDLGKKEFKLDLNKNKAKAVLVKAVLDANKKVR